MKSPSFRFRLLGPLALFAALASGCATPPVSSPRDPGAGASAAFQAPRESDETRAAYALSPAAAALVARADALMDAEQPEAAVAELERALRVEPRNPRLWQRMAAVRLSLGDAAQAESLARKSSRLATDNVAVRSVNWRLIAEARRLQGDQPGYEDAMYRSRELLGR